MLQRRQLGTIIQIASLCKQKKKEQYITRIGRGKNTGGRGIDHIMANRHTECTLAEIYQHAAHLAICASDHYAVFADITLGIN